MVDIQNTFIEKVPNITSSHLEDAISLRGHRDTLDIPLPEKLLNSETSDIQTPKAQEKITKFFDPYKDSEGEIEISKIKIPEYIKQLIEKFPRCIETIRPLIDKHMSLPQAWDNIAPRIGSKAALSCLAKYPELNIPETLNIKETELITIVENYPGLINNPSVIAGDWLNSNKATVFKLLANNPELNIPKTLEFSQEELLKAREEHPILINNHSLVTSRWDILAPYLDIKRALSYLATHSNFRMPKTMVIKENELREALKEHPTLINNPSVITSTWLDSNKATVFKLLANNPELNIPERMVIKKLELVKALKEHPALINNHSLVTSKWDILAPYLDNKRALSYLAAHSNFRMPKTMVIKENELREALKEHPTLINNRSLVTSTWDILAPLLDKGIALRYLASYSELEIPTTLKFSPKELPGVLEKHPTLINNPSVITSTWLDSNKDTVFKLLANNPKLEIPETLKLSQQELLAAVKKYPNLINNRSLVTSRWDILGQRLNNKTALSYLATYPKLEIPKTLEFSPQELEEALRRHPSLINNDRLIPPNWNILAPILDKETALHCLATHPKLEIPQGLEIEKSKLIKVVEDYPNLINNSKVITIDWLNSNKATVFKLLANNPELQILQKLELLQEELLAAVKTHPKLINNHSVITSDWLDSNKDTVFGLLTDKPELQIPETLELSREELVNALENHPNLINNFSVMKRISELSSYFSDTECAKTLKIILDSLDNKDKYRAELQPRKKDQNKKYIPIKPLIKTLILAGFENSSKQIQYSYLIKDCVEKFPQVKSFIEGLEGQSEQPTAVPAGEQSVNIKLEDASKVSPLEVPNDTSAPVEKVSAGTAEQPITSKKQLKFNKDNLEQGDDVTYTPETPTKPPKSILKKPTTPNSK